MQSLPSLLLRHADRLRRNTEIVPGPGRSGSAVWHARKLVDWLRRCPLV
jgi:hypothetical protein